MRAELGLASSRCSMAFRLDLMQETERVPVETPHFISSDGSLGSTGWPVASLRARVPVQVWQEDRSWCLSMSRGAVRSPSASGGQREVSRVEQSW